MSEKDKINHLFVAALKQDSAVKDLAEQLGVTFLREMLRQRSLTETILGPRRIVVEDSVDNWTLTLLENSYGQFVVEVTQNGIQDSFSDPLRVERAVEEYQQRLRRLIIEGTLE